MSQTGSLTVVAGCMFAGKSEKLIRLLKKARYQKKKVVAFKPDVDDRSVDSIQSHDGDIFVAVSVPDAQSIIDLPAVQAADVVGIDEAQFFDEGIVVVCQVLAAQGKRVLVAGLDTDFRGNPFGPMPHLLAVADEVEKRRAACTVCGGDASRSQRVVNNTEQVLTGGKDAYEARCRKHWSPEPVFSQQERAMREEMDG